MTFFNYVVLFKITIILTEFLTNQSPLSLSPSIPISPLSFTSTNTHTHIHIPLIIWESQFVVIQDLIV